MGLIIIGGLISSIVMLISLIFLIRGLVNLISGKCKVGGSGLEGREARMVGLVFILQLPAAMVPWGIVWGIFDLGSGGGSIEEAMARDLANDFFMIVFFLAAILGSYFWAKAYARRNSAPSHSILSRKE